MVTREPRLITAEEILRERAVLRAEKGNISHGTGRGWSSYMWVYCDCPNCRDEYDPTGVESAKFLNMDHTSFFRGQNDIPSFSSSKLVYESFYYAAKPGFYIDADTKRYDSMELNIMLSPPAQLNPSTILYIHEDKTWDEYVLTQERTCWMRRTYKAGRCVYYSETDYLPIPWQSDHEALRLAIGTMIPKKIEYTNL